MLNETFSVIFKHRVTFSDFWRVWSSVTFWSPSVAEFYGVYPEDLPIPIRTKSFQDWLHTLSVFRIWPWWPPISWPVHLALKDSSAWTTCAISVTIPGSPVQISIITADFASFSHLFLPTQILRNPNPRRTCGLLPHAGESDGTHDPLGHQFEAVGSQPDLDLWHSIAFAISAKLLVMFNFDSLHDSFVH